MAVSVAPMGGEDAESIRYLLTGYVREFAAALGPQDFDAEMAELAERYAPPEGRMFVARWEGIVVGCAAWKRFEGTRCELKRMVVAPEARGVGAGRTLAVAVLRDAADHGMTEILLDTVPEMDAARRLYASLGFEACPAYCDSPLRDPVFMRRSLEGLPDHAPPRAPWPGAKGRRPGRPAPSP